MALFSLHGRKRKKTSSTVALPANLYSANASKKYKVEEDTKSDQNKYSPLLDSVAESLNVCRVTERCKGMLPENLKMTSNAKAWSELMHQFNQSRLHPILVWGPTGCGKTRGVKDCATMCGLRIFEIEPSVLDCTEDLRKWISNVTSSKTLLGPRALLVDIIEGFDQSFISVFQSILKKEVLFSIPVVFVADSLHHLPLKNLFSLIPTKIRLFLLNPDNCVTFAKYTFAKNIPKEIVQRHAAKCHGDLRKLKNMINNKFYHDADASLSLFSSTNAMLLGALSLEHWIVSAEVDSLKRLLWDNYVSFATDLDKISDFAMCMGTREILNDPLEFYIVSCGLHFKSLYTGTHPLPKMTLTSSIPQKRVCPVETLDDYTLQSYFLDIPKQLQSREMFASSYQT